MQSADPRPVDRARRAWLVAIVGAGLGLAGCGGKPAETTPTGRAVEGGDGASSAGQPGGGDMVPPEQMDEITHNLERKRPVMARCFAMAVDSHELAKGAAGKLTLEILITAGRATSVSVARTNLSSKMLADCVIAKVKEIQFPELARPYETSFTYGFEAM